MLYEVVSCDFLSLYETYVCNGCTSCILFFVFSVCADSSTLHIVRPSLEWR
jgi:hypothetical protein